MLSAAVSLHDYNHCNICGHITQSLTNCLLFDLLYILLVEVIMEIDRSLLVAHLPKLQNVT